MRIVVISILFLLVACSDEPTPDLSQELLVVYPNPAVYNGKVLVRDPVYPYSIRVFGPDGDLIASTEVLSDSDFNAGGFSFDLQNNKAGRYTVALEMDHKIYLQYLFKP